MPADPESRREQQLERMREPVDEARAKAEQESLQKTERPMDELDVRAKSSGHKKKTAGKWNR